MVAVFKTNPKEEKLQKEYEKLMKEFQMLLLTDRKESDKKFAEAQEILNKIDRLNSPK
jgi:hypothetical protein